MTDPAAILQAFGQRVGAMRVPAGLPDAGNFIFHEVTHHDLSNIADAFDKLLLSSDRVAIVVLEEVRPAVTAEGGSIFTRIDLSVSLMFTDRNIASRHKAMFGDDSTLGVLRMLPTIYAEALGAMTVGVERVAITPGKEPGRLMSISGEDGSDLSDRACFRSVFSISAGDVRQAAARGTRLAR
jgi:hypothetical protein